MSEGDRWYRLIEDWLMGHVGLGATCVIMSGAQEFQMISGWVESHVYIDEQCSMTLDGICLAEGYSL